MIWVLMPPTADPMTGFFFHRASLTVRPKPSLIDFCSTMVEARTRALISMSLNGGRSKDVNIRIRPCRFANLLEHQFPLGIIGCPTAREDQLAVATLFNNTISNESPPPGP